MQNIEKMPVIIKKYPSKGLPPIEFNTFELGDLPSKWSVKIDQQASDKWNSFFDHLGDDMLSKEYAHQDIMYYPGMNSTAPYRNYGGPLTRYVVQNYGPIPINKKITFKGSVTDKYVKRGNGFVTFQLSTYSDNNVLLQKHWRTFMLPSTESDRANYNESNENNTLIQDENILKKFTNMKLICDQDRFNNIEGPGESTAHTDLNIAKARGMPNTTAQACISIAIINRFLTKQFGDKFFTNGFYDIKLIKPTFAGEVMNCNGILLNKSDEDALCKLTIETDHKRLVTVGYGGIEKRD